MKFDDESLSLDSEKPFCCDICFKRFSQRGSLRAHSLTHKAKSFICPECGASFADKSNFKRHCRHRHKMFTAGLSQNLLVNDQELTDHSQFPEHSTGQQLQSTVEQIQLQIQEEVQQHMQIHVAIMQQQEQEQCVPQRLEQCQKRQPKQPSHQQPQHHSDQRVSEEPQKEEQEQLFECAHCSLRLRSESDHLQHVANVHLSEEELRCATCGATYESRFQLVTHVLTHDGVEPHVCTICCRAFGDNLSLLRHLEQLHAGEPVPKNIILGTMSAAEVVDQRVSSELEQCQHCGLECASRVELMSHQSVVHPNAPDVFRCGQCAGVFMTREALTTHQARHAPSQYSCTECGKKFTWKSALTTHLKRHRGLTFTCDLCGKGFSRKSTLQVHERLHSGSKPFPCTLCPKRFTQKTHLSLHMRHHEGTRSHMCDVCGRAFIEKGNMKRHKVLVHSVGKVSKEETASRQTMSQIPSGSECPPSTTSSSVPDYSSKIGGVVGVGDKRVFPCDDCGRAFREKGNMKRHQRLVHGDKRGASEKLNINGENFTCFSCGIVFDEELKMLHHVKRLHPDQVPSDVIVNSQVNVGDCIEVSYRDTMSGTVSDVACDVCGKVLDSNINMIRHRRVVHPEIFQLYNVNSEDESSLSNGLVTNSSQEISMNQLSQFSPPNG